jgi:hypothetical protein
VLQISILTFNIRFSTAVKIFSLLSVLLLYVSTVMERMSEYDNNIDVRKKGRVILKFIVKNYLPLQLGLNLIVNLI